MQEYETVKNYIEKYHMIDKQDYVIVGVSGGADSVCLLLMLQKYMQEQLKEESEFRTLNRLRAVHVHHGIRGEEANRDLNFVKDLCDRFEIPFVAKYFDIPKYAKENGLSEEEAGRIMRYQAFFEQSRILGSENVKIAVAHNVNDNAETIIHNLCRGTGLKGLCGIRPVNNQIIRPLLCLRREQIEKYLLSVKIEYVNDTTNFNDEYTRNRIRRNVLPYLDEHINSQSINHISMAGANILEAETFLEQITKKTYDMVTCVDNNVARISREKMKDVDVYIQKRVIRLVICQLIHKLKDITNTHVEEIRKLLDSQTGKQVDLPYGLCAKVEYDDLIITNSKKRNDDLNEWKDNSLETLIKEEGNYILRGCKGIFSVNVLKIEDMEENVNKTEKSIKIQEKLYTKLIDYDRINNVMRLRYRKMGDYFEIDKMHRTKKLKSYFIDEKIPAMQRDHIPLLADGSHIIWIVGHRISEAYKITKTTTRVLKIQYKEQEETSC